MISMADWAGNEVPGVAKWVSTTPSYQELCSISGTGAPHNATAINTPPDRDQAQKTGHQASELRKVKGSGGRPGQVAGGNIDRQRHLGRPLVPMSGRGQLSGDPYHLAAAERVSDISAVLEDR